jgi:hypothetical protein
MKAKKVSVAIEHGGSLRSRIRRWRRAAESLVRNLNQGKEERAGEVSPPRQKSSPRARPERRVARSR